MAPQIPQEIVAPIIAHFAQDIAHLDRKKRAQALHPLLFVSRTFNYEALRVLHRNVYVKLDVIPSTLARLSKFANAPHICEHVRILKLTMENLAYYDLRHDELRAIIFTALPALRNLETISLNHFRAPFIIPLTELMDPKVVTFKLSQFIVYAGAHPDDGIWELLTTQPTITHFTYLSSPLKPLATPRADINLLPNLQTLHCSAEMAKPFFTTRTPRPKFTTIQLHAGSSVVDLGSMVPTITYLIVTVHSPSNISHYTRYFPNLELLRVFASGWVVDSGHVRQLAQQLKVLPNLRKVYFIDSAAFPNSDLRTVVECVMDELADTLQEGYFDTQLKTSRFLRTEKGKDLDLEENLDTELVENVWDKVRDPVRRM